MEQEDGARDGAGAAGPLIRASSTGAPMSLGHGKCRQRAPLAGVSSPRLTHGPAKRPCRPGACCFAAVVRA